MATDPEIYGGLTEIFHDVFMRDDLVLTPELSAKDVKGWDSFKQIEIIGSTMGSYPEFDQVTGLVAAGLPVAVDEVFDRADYPAALERLAAGEQLGKVVLRHQ